MEQTILIQEEGAHIEILTGCDVEMPAYEDASQAVLAILILGHAHVKHALRRAPIQSM